MLAFCCSGGPKLPALPPKSALQKRCCCINERFMAERERSLNLKPEALCS